MTENDKNNNPDNPLTSRHTEGGEKKSRETWSSFCRDTEISDRRLLLHGISLQFYCTSHTFRERQKLLTQTKAFIIIDSSIFLSFE